MRSALTLVLLALLLAPTAAADVADCTADPRRCSATLDTPAGQSALVTWKVAPTNPESAELLVGTRGGADGSAQRSAGGNYSLNVDARDNGVPQIGGAGADAHAIPGEPRTGQRTGNLTVSIAGDAGGAGFLASKKFQPGQPVYGNTVLGAGTSDVGAEITIDEQGQTKPSVRTGA